MDPCPEDVSERPDRYFDYDDRTGEIVPRNGLTGDTLRRARRTIADLGLNKLDVRVTRFAHTRQFVADLLDMPPDYRQALVNYFTNQPAEYAGVTGMLIERLRKGGQI